MRTNGEGIASAAERPRNDCPNEVRCSCGLPNFGDLKAPSGLEYEGGFVQGTVREARLRPEFASLYPGLEPGVWLPATTIGQKLLLWHLATAATPQGERLMAEEHFEFRGGRGAENRNGARTRASDQYPVNEQ
jgi:hypothetical protein